VDADLIQNSGKLLRVVAVCWDSWESGTGTEKDSQIKEWIKASCAFPCMFEPITINGVQWIMTGNPDLPKPWVSSGQAAFPARLFRVLDIFSDTVMRNDLKLCGLKNDLTELKPEYKKVKIRLLQPSTPLMGDLDFDPGLIKTLMQVGYEDACKLASSLPSTRTPECP
jgi:hypothetical protein